MRLALLKSGDWIGIGFMAAGLGSLTIFLEDGMRRDWFAWPMILLAYSDSFRTLTLVLLAMIPLVFFCRQFPTMRRLGGAIVYDCLVR